MKKKFKVLIAFIGEIKNIISLNDCLIKNKIDTEIALLGKQATISINSKEYFRALQIGINFILDNNLSIKCVSPKKEIITDNALLLDYITKNHQNITFGDVEKFTFQNEKNI